MSDKIENSGNNTLRWVIVVVVLMLAAGVFLMRPTAQSSQDNQQVETAVASNLPALKDFGSDKCIPCKTMAPILEELKIEFAGKFTVDFYDIWKDNTEGSKHGIQVIPTQIFFAADGTELFRHEGFYSREDILNKWLELKIEI